MSQIGSRRKLREVDGAADSQKLDLQALAKDYFAGTKNHYMKLNSH
jgi:hypothetical protein